jgi:hypothetical protein
LLVFEADDVEDGLAHGVEEAVHLGVGHRVPVLRAVLQRPTAQDCAHAKMTSAIHLFIYLFIKVLFKLLS